LNKLLRKLKDTGTTDRRSGSGRPCARTTNNVNTASDLVLSQEDTPRSHRHGRLQALALASWKCCKVFCALAVTAKTCV